MILKLADWTFDVDVDVTKAYSQQEAAEHCDCAYCRNFYSAVDAAYPELRAFLAQFGLNIDVPDEMTPYADGCYAAFYAVNGRILHTGTGPIPCGNAEIYPMCAEEAKVNTWITPPFFFLGTGLLTLPWVLSEPEEEPPFLRRLLQKLADAVSKNSKFS